MPKNKIIVLLFIGFALASCHKKKDENKKALWIQEAFESLATGSYPLVKAISWWDENFEQTMLKVNSSPESLNAYRIGVMSSTYISEPVMEAGKLVAVDGSIYHAAFPDFGGSEDVVTATRISKFENLVGKRIAWAYFSNNWYDQISFPLDEVNAIHNMGRQPFIRMMPRSEFYEGQPDPVYTMGGIINGEFDTDLIQWAVDAAAYGNPLLVEFGTEVNGSWFSWNGLYNGADSLAYGDPNLYDGPERFRDAYRHIVDICNAQGATNITWFYHVDAYSEPEDDWNDIANYYPGDDYVDWLGVSIYGPQVVDDEFQSFSDILGEVYPSLTALADKPIAILEFAITEF